MTSDRGKLTMKAAAEKKEAVKRFLANGRYMTKGNPRQGGIASVYRAFDTQDERHVALKVFRQVSGTDDVVEESFRRETQALSDLKHPNIVEILDYGIDSESGEHFIAMEWVNHDLATARSVKPYASWLEFFNPVGQQVLEALAFAHSHATVHRDIKPTNILVTDEGVAKVCDFGISKIRNFLAPGVTLAQYASLPFAPPEPDDGSYSYSRDVFGFAALCVATLSPSTIDTYQQLKSALEQLTIDEPVRRLLRRCLSENDPAERPQNAIVLLGEFERLQPRATTPTKGVILVSLTKKVRDIIDIDLNLSSDTAIEKFVALDLDDVVCEHARDSLNEQVDNQQSMGRAILLHAGKYSYMAAVESPHGQRLKLVSALDLSASELERRRERAQRADYRFQLSGASAQDSGNCIEALQEALATFSADQKALQAEQREQALYKTWLDLLGAKTELEKIKKVKLRYERFEPTGAGINFTFAKSVEASLLADKDIRIELPSGEFLGSVVSAGEGYILVQPSERNRLDPSVLPDTGTLAVDTTKADAALSKQKSAIDAVR